MAGIATFGGDDSTPRRTLDFMLYEDRGVEPVRQHIQHA
jgi:hypothetical protein